MRAFPPEPLPPKPATLTRRTFIAGSFSSAALAFYADDVSRHEIDLTHRTFQIPNLPAPFDGFRIVQFSDIHLEEYTEDFFLRRVLSIVNSLNPDMVLVTGDFVSRGPMPARVGLAAAGRCAELLSGLNCPLRFGILGNHDVFVGARVVRDHLENNGLPILVNQFVPIERGNARIILGGIDDFAGGHPNLSLAVPENPDAPVILMAHEPDFATRVAVHPRGRNVSLVLSGHSHGGQVRIPGFRPLALPPLGRIYPEGHYTIGNFQLYVNRGIGTVGVPFRLNCPPEITLITLRPNLA